MHLSFTPLGLFIAATIARMGWQFGGALNQQVEHQVDRFFDWMHRRQAAHAGERARVGLAGQVAPSPAPTLNRELGRAMRDDMDREIAHMFGDSEPEHVRAGFPNMSTAARHELDAQMKRRDG